MTHLYTQNISAQVQNILGDLALYASEDTISDSGLNYQRLSFKNNFHNLYCQDAWQRINIIVHKKKGSFYTTLLVYQPLPRGSQIL